MWSFYTVYNETPYTFHYCSKGREGVHTVHGNSTGTYPHAFLPLWGLSFRYGDHSESDLTGHGGGASYTIRESRDGKEFELVHNMLGVVDRCPNFGKIDEEKQNRERRQQEEQRRKQDEEKRRQDKLERQRKIQEQIEKENITLRKQLSEAHNRLHLEQKFKAREHYQQHSQVLHHLVEDHAHHIERDEVTDVNEKFEELLSKYDIKEDENLKIPLEDRMKMLQNELTLQYFRKHSIPTSSQWALDQATGYVHLSLTERFNILEAVAEVTLEGCPDFEGVLTTGQDKMTEFLLNLQEELHAENPTLAREVLANVLDLSPTLPWSGKEILSQILFNNIWTPKEIKLFIGQTLSMDQKIVTQILHKVCTYRLSSDDALSALKEEYPVECIQHCVDNAEQDKDADTVLTEMKDKNYPEKILSLLREVLTYTEEVLPKLESVLINGKMIVDCKGMITSLDFNNPDIGALKKILIILCKAVKNCTTFTTQSGEQVQGYFPRLTQLASLLLLLLPQSEDETNCLLEISTGEGKTCILAMFATIQAIRGTKVDIVTSSPLLASRDQDEWIKLYDMFGITSSTVPPPHINNCSFKDHDKLLEDAYRQQVVYGTVSTFAADILRQEFEKKTTRGQRKFECVVVDEVDYMTLDSGVQVTYLSHQAGSLRHVEQVLASIWAMMSACRPIEMFETGEIKWGTRIHHFHKTVIQAVFGSESEGFSATDILMLGAQLGFYSQEDVDELNQAGGQIETETDSFNAKWKATEKIMAKIGLEEQCELLRKLEQINENSVSVDCYSLVNNKAKLYRKESSHSDPDVSLLLLENGRACEIMSEKSLIEGTVDKLKSTIKYSDQCSLKSLDECKGFIVIPSFLKTYIETQLRVFADNALKAIRMTQGREYMIEKAPEAHTGGLSDTDSHQYDAIIPVDFDASGVLEKNKRWGEGLQQFLEMKHQLAISQLSNVTNYMSNVHFFKRYLSGKGIFGVSGTLGGDAEKEFLERHYKTASYVVPAHRHKKLVELPAVQVSGGGTQWIQVICETAQRAADRGQVVLIICEDVRTADELKTNVHGPERRANQITMYTISEKHNIEKQKFSQGNIIIATNLGGRGTDIHVQQEVNECGGLFVLLTYFPRSQRVERQVFGRTARKGNPGMVQMILNQDHLASAYQGHSIETMRLLREECEVSNLDSMEKNELCEIEMKETLFTSFCQFLCDFDKNYTEEERSDLSKMKLNDVPECFKIHWNKFDYQTALNALKESWALWLILHEEHISRHNDISKLREDLTKDLKKTGDLLLQGTSNNFYDYIKQATSRTELQNINKTKCDFGAKTYLQSAVECDHLYSAVALYNHAYITLNLRKKGYITEATKLLEEAQIAVDVYLSESTNTMMFCNLSVSGFAQHHTNSNLQIQIQARMNIFKSWKGYIERALTTLRQLDGSNDDAEVEDSSVYHLLKDKDLITTNELKILYDNGLGIIFEVKKKPEFSYDALVCFLLGALQVAAGVLVCALSCGGASHFGLGLICEGVSDIIKGIKGMIQGGFDWAEWAISKAINIGLSLISGGFGRLRKAASLVRSGTKALITGTKTTAFTVKQCFWKAGKYAVQELGKQGCVNALSYAADKGINAFFQNILREAFEKKVFSLMKDNNELDKVLTNFICSGISMTALENGSSEFSIDNECEKQMRQSVDLMTKEVIPGLMMDCTKVLNVLATLSEVCSAVTQHIESQKWSQHMGNIQMCLKAVTNVTVCVQILNSVPTEKVINNTFLPELLQIMKKLPQEENEQDGRHSLSHVRRLKDELINMIAQSVLNSYVEACSRHMNSIMTKKCMSEINHAAGSAVSNILGRADTQGFFYNQEYKYDMKKAMKSPCDSLSESTKKDLESYIGEISDVNRPATALDIHVLTQSDALEGKGIKLVMVDKDGKKLSEDYFPGKDNSAGDIVLQLKKEPENPQQTEGFFSKITKRIVGKQSPYSGHFEILKPDDTIIPVNSDGKNCLYHAVAQATCKNPGDLREDAMVLRNEVKNTLQQNLHRYAEVLKLQKGYEETYNSTGKYYICGGDQKARKEAIKNFETIWDKTSKHSLSEDELQLIQEQRLGLVGTHADVYRVRVEKAKQRGGNRNHPPVEADHVPPKCVFQNVLEKLQDPENVKFKETLKNKNPNLYSMLDKSGNRGLCREVLKSHHEAGLTWRNRKESRIISEKLEEILISGDGEKLVKMSLMAANPIVSNGLRKDAGIPDRQQAIPREMSDNATKQYHDAGDKLLVEGYYKMGIINKEGKKQIMKWLEEGQLYSMNTSEYKEICTYLNSKKNKNNNK